MSQSTEYVSPSGVVTPAIGQPAAEKSFGAFGSSRVSYTRRMPQAEREGIHRRSMPSGSATALATLLSGMLALLAVVIWPGFLERHISLDWRIGSVRTAAYVLQAAFAATAVVVA